MRLRTAAIAFLVSVLSVGAAWFSLQPLIAHFIDAAHSGLPPSLVWLRRAQSTLPLILGLDIAAATLLAYAVLYWMVGRPLRKTEQAVEQLGRLGLEMPLEWSGGTLLSRLQGALSRTARALLDEKAVSSQQLTALQKSNTRLASAQAELAAAERLATVGRLAAGVAHEVGNPLSGILGYLSIARARTQDPELLDYLVRIEQEVQRIDEIVRSLLDLGRPAKGALGPVELAPLARNCVRLAGANPELARVQVEIEVAPETSVQAAPGPLSQVLLNLLINAGQAMEGEGRVSIRSHRDDASGRVIIDVQDSGPGIAPEHLHHLFEPFFTTRSAERGTGLGLAISRQLIASMGGELTASNAEGQGALFTIRLPST